MLDSRLVSVAVIFIPMANLITALKEGILAWPLCLN